MALSFRIVGAIVLLSFMFTGSSGADDSWTSHRLSKGRTVELKGIQEGQYQWFQTRDGYSVVRTPNRYEYAIATPEGGITSSGLSAVSGEPPLKLTTGIRPTPEFLRKQRASGTPAFSPPSPMPVIVRQPNGAELSVTLKGGPGMSWYEDKQGYSIITVSGRFEYAVRSPSGELMGCGVEVNSMNADEIGLRVGIRPSDAFLLKKVP